MNSNMAALEGVILWHSQWLYDEFERVGYAEAKRMADKASEHSCERALQYECGNKARFPIPHLDEQRCSAGVVLAIMPAFLVWSQKRAGHPLPDSPLLKAAEDGWKMWRLLKGKASKWKKPRK